MTDDTFRLGVYILWAVGSVLVWGRVFMIEYQRYDGLPATERRRTVNTRSSLSVIRHRAFRELVSDFALFLVALASAISLLILVLGPEMSGPRGFALALALGAFLGAGIVRLR